MKRKIKHQQHALRDYVRVNTKRVKAIDEQHRQRMGQIQHVFFFKYLIVFFLHPIGDRLLFARDN